MKDREVRHLARDLAEGLLKGQRLLALRQVAAHWSILYQLGDGWDLQGQSPRLLLLKLANQSGEPSLVMESQNDPRFSSYPSSELPFRSALCLPLLSSAGGFLGAILLEDPERPRAFLFQDAEHWKSKVEPLVQALERLPIAKPELPFLSPGRLIVLAVVVALCIAMGVGASRPQSKPTKTPGGKLQTRKTASPEIVAASFVSALSRRDFRAAYALTVDGEKKSGSFNHFVQWAEGWRGEQRQAWSLQYRQVRLAEEGQDFCKVALDALGPAKEMPPLYLELLRLEEGWRLQTRSQKESGL